MSLFPGDVKIQDGRIQVCVVHWDSSGFQNSLALHVEDTQQKYTKEMDRWIILRKEIWTCVIVLSVNICDVGKSLMPLSRFPHL